MELTVYDKDYIKKNEFVNFEISSERSLITKYIQLPPDDSQNQFGWAEHCSKACP
jgi:hypothetical protein